MSPRRDCEVKGCLMPARFLVVDRSSHGHPVCHGHLDAVAGRYMRADDCLAVEERVA